MHDVPLHPTYSVAIGDRRRGGRVIWEAEPGTTTPGGHALSSANVCRHVVDASADAVVKMEV